MSVILQPGRLGRLYAELASSREDVIASQRLRYRIFAEELGARLASRRKGIDEDPFDRHCQHLLVRETGSGRIVASTRLLTEEAARLAGGFYSATEFSLEPVTALPGRKLEIGRTCVDPAYRQGAAIAVLWAGLAGFIHLNRIDYLFGCASIDIADGGLRARAITNQLLRHSFVGEGRRVVPRIPLPAVPGVDDTIAAPLPPLLKAYVRLGARACGEACWDRDFDVADVFMLLDVDELDPSYSRHFMARAVE
jgi:putative hemolysin